MEEEEEEEEEKIATYYCWDARYTLHVTRYTHPHPESKENNPPDHQPPRPDRTFTFCPTPCRIPYARSLTPIEAFTPVRYDTSPISRTSPV